MNTYDIKATGLFQPWFQLPKRFPSLYLDDFNFDSNISKERQSLQVSPY